MKKFITKPSLRGVVASIWNRRSWVQIPAVVRGVAMLLYSLKIEVAEEKNMATKLNFK
jgi:hypothetical protein